MYWITLSPLRNAIQYLNDPILRTRVGRIALILMAFLLLIGTPLISQASMSCAALVTTSAMVDINNQPSLFDFFHAYNRELRQYKNEVDQLRRTIRGFEFLAETLKRDLGSAKYWLARNNIGSERDVNVVGGVEKSRSETSRRLSELLQHPTWKDAFGRLNGQIAIELEQFLAAAPINYERVKIQKVLIAASQSTPFRVELLVEYDSADFVVAVQTFGGSAQWVIVEEPSKLAFDPNYYSKFASLKVGADHQSVRKYGQNLADF